MSPDRVSRRAVVGAMAAGAAAIALGPDRLHAAVAAPQTKPIPSTGEQVPVVGLGSWSTFNVGKDTQLLDECTAVISAFLAAGGRMIDSSPMYGSSQATIGYALGKLGHPPVFSADKVWTSSGARGPGTDTGIAHAMGHQAVRPAAGAQPPRVGSSSCRCCSP